MASEDRSFFCIHYANDRRATTDAGLLPLARARFLFRFAAILSGGPDIDSGKDMIAFTNAFFLIYAALFPIVNPIGGAPLFLGMTQFCTDTQRNALARRIAVNSFFLLLGSLFIGSYVLEFFGISVPAVRIAGGLVVASFGWKLLNSGVRPDGESAPAGVISAVPDSFYPLTMPLTVGPGSISVAITLGSQRPSFTNLAHLALLASAAIAGILAIAITVYLSYRFAERTIAKLGKSGTDVFVRLSAFIMLCIGIQIIWSGWSELSSLAG